jgi:hypothetical protein
LYPEDAVGDPTQQVHDFEPGIAPSGLFWTLPIDRSAIDVDADDGTARFQAEDVAVSDFGNFFNAISPSPSPQIPSHVSFDVRWAGGGPRQTIRDAVFGFSGKFVAGPATVTFSASNDGGVVYTSESAGQNTILSGVGHERNGRFFTHDDNNNDDSEDDD